MKDKIISSGKWIKDLKWWQQAIVLLIMFPAVLGILFSTGKQVFEIYWYDIKGNVKLGQLERRNVSEFKRHFQEAPIHKQSIKIDAHNVIELAYYGTDGCILIVRKSLNNTPVMTWLPLSTEKLITHNHEHDNSLVTLAYAAPIPMASAHDGDPYFVDVAVRWLDQYTILMHRGFRDGCVGEYQLYAPTGATCCWQWLVYKHRR